MCTRTLSLPAWASHRQGEMPCGKQPECLSPHLANCEKCKWGQEGGARCQTARQLTTPPATDHRYSDWDREHRRVTQLSPIQITDSHNSKLKKELRCDDTTFWDKWLRSRNLTGNGQPSLIYFSLICWIIRNLFQCNNMYVSYLVLSFELEVFDLLKWPPKSHNGARFLPWYSATSSFKKTYV